MTKVLLNRAEMSSANLNGANLTNATMPDGQIYYQNY
jgi:uncharacterized protein YjbI with pentapeptide repeats